MAPSPTDATTLDGVPNFRDIGGYVAADGRVVRSRRVYRSGMLGVATDQDLVTLETLGVRTVIDLRTQLEVDSFGADRLPGGASLVRLPIPTVGADPVMVEAMETNRFPVLADLVEVNRSYVVDDAERLGQVLELLSEPANHPVVIHCLGGKDRTGVVAALLLTILDVPWATVRDDYLRSNEYFQDAMDDPQNPLSRAMEDRLGHPPDFGGEDSKRNFFILEPAYIDVVFDEMTKLNGSFPDFVRERLGLSEAVCDRLREGLLEPQGSTDASLQTPDHTIDAGEPET